MGWVNNSQSDLIAGRLVSAAGKGPIVLIIEDHPSQAEFLATIVTSLGYSFELASDGSEGLSCLQRVRPVLILLDLNMPQFDGLGFLKRFKARGAFADVPVIVITASQSIDTITKVCSMGARDFIAKPVDPATLIAKVQKHAPIKTRR